MNRLVKTAEITAGDRAYAVRYYEVTTARGLRRYAAEITLGPGDCVILDDDSIEGLEARAPRLVPATLQSRQLARKRPRRHAAA